MSLVRYFFISISLFFIIKFIIFYQVQYFLSNSEHLFITPTYMEKSKYELRSKKMNVNKLNKLINVSLVRKDRRKNLAHNVNLSESCTVKIKTTICKCNISRFCKYQNTCTNVHCIQNCSK